MSSADRASSDLPELSPAEVRRYSRHLTLPEVGVEGQRRLKAGSVLLVGAGGLGSPASLYLAAAGVGRLGLVEFDRVEETNLQRQILYGGSDLGRPKLDAALERLRQVNPEIELVPHDLRLDSSNAIDLVSAYDLVVDGSDNFPTRYLVNDACVLAGKPDVYGSIFRFEGQLSVFWGARGPCYRCLFPEPPPPGMAPSCAEGGVLGALPGIIGAMQASEAVKLLLKVGRPAVGRLVLYDALKLELREVELVKDPRCPVCSERPTLTRLIDYDRWCGAEARPAPAEPPAGELTVRQLAERLERGEALTLLDIRTPQERRINRLEGSRFVPLPELPGRLEELDRDRPLVVYCHHGVRSARAVQFLRSQGFPQAINLRGGIDAWSREVDPSVALY